MSAHSPECGCAEEHSLMQTVGGQKGKRDVKIRHMLREFVVKALQVQYQQAGLREFIEMHPRTDAGGARRRPDQHISPHRGRSCCRCVINTGNSATRILVWRR
jgi:hypothetical protein